MSFRKGAGEDDFGGLDLKIYLLLLKISKNNNINNYTILQSNLIDNHIVLIIFFKKRKK
jgi:hypothetical protein